ncbi:MAG TPA: response regulator [Candidatus Saccharibacteria bacterium]|nr:response regulator [Candidatus Saccharibacteria bacterium]
MTKQASILIVEDDVDLNNAYKMILSSAGYDVTSALNGQEALASIKKAGDPDIMFLDLRMPVMDGIEFLKAYDAPAHDDTTIIVFSNYDAQKEVDKAYDLGAHRYVLKARAAPKELIRIVQDTLASVV